jgi:hypothetical protein
MGSKWESFNDRSMRVLQLGNQVALSTRSDEICTEHLLLGLLRAGTLKLADHINMPDNLREDRQQNVRRLRMDWVAALVRRVRSGKRQNRDRHAMLLQKTLSDGKCVVVEPRWAEGGGEQAGNPTDHLLILGPLKVDLEPKGIVEVFQRPGAPPMTQRGYLKFLLQMCDLANGYLKNRQ